MSGGTHSQHLSDPARQRASIVLGVASVLVAALALVTATQGPATITSALPGHPVTPAAPPKPVAEIAITSASATPINPTVPVSVQVSHGTLRSVTVTDGRTGKQLTGEMGPGSTSWHTTGPLSYANTYQVSADAIGTDGQPVQQTGTVSTVKPAQLVYPSFIPAPGQSSAGVGQPLVVKFDHPIPDKATAERALRVTTSPEQPGSWYWISPSEVHYRAASYWQPGTTIQLTATMFGVDLGKGTFGQTNRSATIHIHDSWVAKADGASKTMQIFQNGKLVNSMPISLGSPGHPSHEGPHVISDKQPSIIMDSCTYGVCQGQPGYYKEKVDLDLRISNDGEFVHSAPWSVGQQGSDNVSHGCVNLSPENAQWFFDHFNVGDVVEITNSGGPTLPVYDTYGDWELSWAQWRAGSALH